MTAALLRVSKLTDYDTVVMTCLAGAEGVLSAQALTERARLEMPTVTKLLKQLAQAGLVESFRGVRDNPVARHSSDSLRHTRRSHRRY